MNGLKLTGSAKLSSGLTTNSNLKTTKTKAVEIQNVEASEYPFEVTGFFEQVGFLVEKKFIDLDVVADRLGTRIILNWQKLEPWIAGVRKEKGDLTYGEHFQRLYQRTADYMKKR